MLCLARPTADSTMVGLSAVGLVVYTCLWSVIVDINNKSFIIVDFIELFDVLRFLLVVKRCSRYNSCYDMTLLPPLPTAESSLLPCWVCWE